jgi:hypothetical protein
VLELPQRLASICRNRKLLAALLQRVVAVHAEAEAYALGLKVKLVMPTASSQRGPIDCLHSKLAISLEECQKPTN